MYGVATSSDVRYLGITVLKNMLNGTLYNVEIVVTYGEKGKSVIIDGQKTEVYQA